MSGRLCFCILSVSFVSCAFSYCDQAALACCSCPVEDGRNTEGSGYVHWTGPLARRAGCGYGPRLLVHAVGSFARRFRLIVFVAETSRISSLGRILPALSATSWTTRASATISISWRKSESGGGYHPVPFSVLFPSIYSFDVMHCLWVVGVVPERV